MEAEDLLPGGKEKDNTSAFRRIVLFWSSHLVLLHPGGGRGEVATMFFYFRIFCFFFLGTKEEGKNYLKGHGIVASLINEKQSGMKRQG